MVDGVRWLSAEEQSLWREWLRVHARQHLAIAQDLRGVGLSEPDFEVLVHLSEQREGGLRMSRLADELQWERSRLSHQIARMVKRGLVERHEVAEDGRGSCVVITRRGRKVIEEAAPGHVKAVRDVFLDHLDNDDRAALAHILAKVQK